MCSLAQTATTIDDEKENAVSKRPVLSESEDEMRKIFAYAPEAIENTHKIAMECNVEHLRRLSSAGVYSAGGTDECAVSASAVPEGLAQRYSTGVTEELQERLITSFPSSRIYGLCGILF